MSDPATLSATAARRLLALRDLTDAHQGHHAIQDVVDEIAGAVDVAGTRVTRRSQERSGIHPEGRT